MKIRQNGLNRKKNIDRQIQFKKGLLPAGETIAELSEKPYDISRVKEFVIESEKSKIKIVSKRLDLKQLEEIALARRA